MAYQPYTGEGDVGQAHQSLMREEWASIEKKTLDFNPSDLVLSDAFIRPIERRDAKPVIEQYEYLKCMPAVSTHHFGIYFNTLKGERLGGVLVYGPDYAKNLGHWDKYGYTDNMLLLSRGVCLWWTPHNTASYFISRANRWLRDNTDFRVITATVDAMAGEVGTIYQSLNWDYVGSMRRANPNVKAKSRSNFTVQEPFALKSAHNAKPRFSKGGLMLSLSNKEKRIGILPILELRGKRKNFVNLLNTYFHHTLKEI